MATHLLFVAQCLAILIALPFLLLGQIGQWGMGIVRGPYYRIVQARRKLAGEPLWKPYDALLGIGAPFLTEAQMADLAHAPAAGLPTPDRVQGWLHDLEHATDQEDVQSVVDEVRKALMLPTPARHKPDAPRGQATPEGRPAEGPVASGKAD
jgi:hypothetical protein